MWFMCSDSSKHLAGMLADMQGIMAFPLHMCSAFPAEKVEQMIVTSLNDVTMIAHAIGEGSI